MKKEEKTSKKKAPDKVKDKIDFEPETNDTDAQDVHEQEMILDFVLEEDRSDLEEEHIQEILNSLNEELSKAQRVKKGLIMKRYKSKIKNSRKRQMKRRANIKVLQKRAKRQAISNMKKIIAKGRDLNKASASEKNRIERLVKRRKKLVDRMSKRLVNSKRSQDAKRLQRNSVEMTGNSLVETFDIFYNTLKKEDD